MIAWVNGRWVEESEGAISVADRGFTLGDGLFETILWENGALARFSRHAARLERSALELGLPAPPQADVLEALGRDALDRNNLAATRSAVRISWSAGTGMRGLQRPGEFSPVLVVTVAPAPRAEGPMTLAISGILRNETAPSSRLKTLSYVDNIAARAEATGAGADEALQFNTKGMLAGGASSNVFLALDGEVRTPAVTDGALPGTVRAALIEQGLPIRAGPISRGELERAEAVALSNAVQPWREAVRLGDRCFAPGHELLRSLRVAALEAP